MNEESASYVYNRDVFLPKHQGMTLRDYFAAKALPLAMQQYRMDINLLPNEPLPAWGAGECLSFVAADAYKMADAMMAERAE